MWIGIPGKCCGNRKSEVLPAPAKRFCLSFATFRRLWSLHHTDPQGVAIQKLRNRYARDLLCDRQLSIEEVAEMAGYPLFLPFFRRLNGMTPNQFRSQHDLKAERNRLDASGQRSDTP